MSATSYTSTKYKVLFVAKKLFSTVFVGFKCSYCRAITRNMVVMFNPWVFILSRYNGTYTQARGH